MTWPPPRGGDDSPDAPSESESGSVHIALRSDRRAKGDAHFRRGTARRSYRRRERRAEAPTTLLTVEVARQPGTFYSISCANQPYLLRAKFRYNLEDPSENIAPNVHKTLTMLMELARKSGVGFLDFWC